MKSKNEQIKFDYEYLFEKHKTKVITKRNERGKDIKIKEDVANVVTPSGEIDLKDWINYTFKVLDDRHEEHIYELLLKYTKENAIWLESTEEFRRFTLQCYSKRIWEDHEWVHYEEFQRDLKKMEK